MKKVVTLIGSSALIALCGAAETAPSNFSIVNRFHLDGNGGWDCCAIDDATGRLFVAHESQVQVLDVASGKLVGTIADTKGVHGIAFAHDVNKVYTSNGKENTVSVADLKTLALIKKVKLTGEDPDAISYDPFTHRIFSFNGKSENATVIDTKTDSVVGTVALGGGPEFSEGDGTGLLYVNLEDKNEVAVIDTKKMSVIKKWSVAPGTSPCSIALDTKDHRLFIGCRSKVMVVLDMVSGKQIASLPIGDHVDGAAFDADKQLVYFSNGQGTITVVKKTGSNGYAVQETIPTQKGAKTIALSMKSHHLYLPTADYNAAPAPTADNAKPKASVKEGTFMILDVAPMSK